MRLVNFILEKTVAGFVYILSNPAFPDLLKIGQSTKDPSTFRKGELYTTGVPLPYECEYYIYADRFDWLERSVHEELEEYRVNEQREFFEISLDRAIKVIQTKANKHEIFLFEKFGKEVNGKDIDSSLSYETDSFLENYRIQETRRLKNLKKNNLSYDRKQSSSREIVTNENEGGLKKYQFRQTQNLKKKPTDLPPVKVHEPMDEVGQTALHRAVIAGRASEILRLLEEGASKDTKDHYGKTPWDYAQLNEKIFGTTAYFVLKSRDRK